MKAIIPTELKTIKESVYDPCGFEFNLLQINPESKEYCACTFALNEDKIEHRVAKITPTKTGQFVAIWRRNGAGITQPYESNDDLNFLVITVRSNEKLGQFIFPKSVLIDKKIISHNGNEGKRGIRVYPPWDIAKSKQAEKSQKWQLKYFLPIDDNNFINFEKAKHLFRLII